VKIDEPRSLALQAFEASLDEQILPLHEVIAAHLIKDEDAWKPSWRIRMPREATRSNAKQQRR
jgi:hypothetical protein